MSTLIKKENITIITGEYNDQQGNPKKRYKTIAELITMQGDDGSYYQFGEMWGPHGVTKFNVYPQEDKNAQAQGAQNYQQAPPQQGGYQQQQAPQQGYQQPNQGYQQK